MTCQHTHSVSHFPPTPSAGNKQQQLISEFAEIKAFLLQIGILEGDIEPIRTRFHLPQYQVKTLLELFALEEEDIDEILSPLPLAKRRVINKRIQEQVTGIPMTSLHWGGV
jgi:hypothetical protein